MTIKRLILTVVLTAAAAYVLLILMMTPTQPTSGSGEGNILTTQNP
jgi:hypothetical protein